MNEWDQPICAQNLWSDPLRSQTYLYVIKVLVAQSYLTLCDPMDYSSQGSSVHGSLWARITGASSHSLLQGIFPTQGSNPCLLHCRQISYRLSYQGSFRHPPKPLPGAEIMSTRAGWPHTWSGLTGGHLPHPSHPGLPALLKLRLCFLFV